MPLVKPLAKPLIIIGYSEGGIVARQLIAKKLPVQALVTICSPHHGLGYWMPTPDVGSASVSPFSDDLSRLNNSTEETKHRGSYHLFAISCSDFFGYHSDDGVVPISSGLGDALGAIPERTPIHLNYGDKQIAGWDPHHRGTDPTHLGPVLTTCSQLLALSMTSRPRRGPSRRSGKLKQKQRQR